MLMPYRTTLDCVLNVIVSSTSFADNCSCQDEITLLDWVCRSGSLTALRFLLEHGMNPNYCERFAADEEYFQLSVKPNVI